MTTATQPLQSALYQGRVMHLRLERARHQFRYRVFSLYLDLDELPSLDKRLKLFSYNRFNMLSFHDRDHGAGDGSPVRDWAAAQIRAADLGWDGGPIRLLCFPRLWGYVFNPLAIYFAFQKNGALAGMLYQVSNTFGERHSYVLAASVDDTGMIRHGCAKHFHVSPFFGMEYRYRFRLRVPDEKLAVAIRMDNAKGPALIATQSGFRQPLSDQALAGAVARHPLMTLKVIAAIHWQALKLWRKGVPFHKKPPPPFDSVSQEDRISAPVLAGGGTKRDG